MPLDAQAVTIAKRVRTVIQAINGTSGGYTFDLTVSPDNADFGDTATASLPCVVFAGIDIVSDDAATLTKYDHQMVIEMTCYADSETDNSDARLFAATNLVSDVHLAIARDRVLVDAASLNALTTKVGVGPGTAFDGASVQLGDYGVASTRVTLSYRTSGGI